MNTYENLNLQYIGGAWRPGSSTERINDVNPYSQDILLTVQGATREDVDAAYMTAKEADKAWGLTSFTQRREVLKKTLN